MRARTSTSIGTVETWGHTAAVAALDVGLKAATVVFGGYRITPSGLVTIVFRGDVAAVRTAVDAAVAAAGKVGHIAAHHVIARPHEQLQRLLQPPPPETGPGKTGGPKAGPPPDPPKPDAAARATRDTPAKSARKRSATPRGGTKTRPADAAKTRGKASLLKKTTPPAEPPSRPTPAPRKRTTTRKRSEDT